jgi:uncharacterized membrane protein
MNFSQKDHIEIVENAISWIVVLAMLVYGAGKIVQFEDAVDISKTVSDMNGMELMWAFYSYSKPFVYTIGLFEILGGILILIKTTRLIGCLFSSVILVNVIIQDIYFGVHLGALKAAIFYQVLILIILWLHRKKMLASIKMLLTTRKKDKVTAKHVLKLLIALGIFILLRILEYYMTIK